MKINNSSAPVQVVGGGSTSSFSIAANGKAFKVLSSTLYSDKIGSIVREISCNALDAQVVAKTDHIPFEIHIPDEFEPWFSVRDFGIGLSEEDIHEVFTVFFQSTKEQSNNVIGCFGLGSKTPFSYTDQFTVESIHNGKRVVYSAYLAADGMPCIVKMHEEETEDDAGVKVHLSVKREDYTKFADAVISQLRFFKVKPKLLNTSREFEEFKYTFEGENINILTRKNHTYLNRIWIVQGNVGYPLDMSIIQNSHISEKAKSILRGMTGIEAVIKFDIGEIGVTASREAVEYDEQTVKNISDRFEKIQQELFEYVKEVTTNKSPWGQLNFCQENNLWTNLFSALGYKIPKATNNLYFDIANIRFNPSVFGVEIIHATRKQPRAFSSFGAGGRFYSNSCDRIFIVDTKKKFSARIAKYREDNHGLGGIYLVHMQEGASVQAVKQAIDDFIPGFPNTVVLSEIELPEKEKTVRVKSKLPSLEFYKVSSVSSSFWTRSSDSIDSLKKQGHKIVYTVTHGKTIVDSKNTEKYLTVRSCNDSKYNSVPELIGIPKRSLDKIKDDPQFVHVDVFVEEIIKKLEKDSRYKLYFKRDSLLQTISLGLPWEVHSGVFANILATTAQKSDLGRLVKIRKNLLNYVTSFGSKNNSDVNMYRCLVGGNQSSKKFKYPEKIKDKYFVLFTALRFSSINTDNAKKYIEIVQLMNK